MKLWLVRHARPLAPDGICYGASDIPADAADTALAAQRLAQQLPTGVPVFCSPLTRCVQLADALVAVRPDLVAMQDARLREIDFGIWEGQVWADIPCAAMQTWTDDFFQHRFGGKESVQDLMGRVAAALHDTRLPSAGARHEALWITHAGVARAAALLAQGIDAVPSADRWPRAAPGFGHSVTIHFPSQAQIGDLVL